MHTVPQDCFDKEKSSKYHYGFFNTNLRKPDHFCLFLYVLYKNYSFILEELYWMRAWQPIPAILPGESPWTLDYSPWGGKELDMTV